MNYYTDMQNHKMSSTFLVKKSIFYLVCEDDVM